MREREEKSEEMSNVIDSHCHLDFPDFAPDLDGIVDRARAADVARMVSISTRVAKFDALVAGRDELAVLQQAAS